MNIACFPTLLVCPCDYTLSVIWRQLLMSGFGFLGELGASQMVLPTSYSGTNQTSQNKQTNTSVAPGVAPNAVAPPSELRPPQVHCLAGSLHSLVVPCLECLSTLPLADSHSPSKSKTTVIPSGSSPTPAPPPNSACILCLDFSSQCVAWFVCVCFLQRSRGNLKGPASVRAPGPGEKNG